MSQWVLITGAARRIGRVTALALADAGWDVILHYNQSRADAEILHQDIQAKGRKAHLIQAELADETAVRHLVPTLTAELGALTALVNNASLFEPDPQDPTGQRHQAINVTAPRLLSDSFYAAHRDHPSRHLPVIVNLLDANPTKPTFRFYNQSKTALVAMTCAMALRFAPHLRVNGVALGAILPSPRESQHHFDDLVATSPLGTAIAPDAVAAAVCFLIENPALTGVIIPVDGGMHLTNRSGLQAIL